MSDTLSGAAVVIVATAALAPMLADWLARWVAVPSVVLEIVLGIMIGPVVLGWVKETEPIDGLANLGLAMLMFLAGYEIDFERVKGDPLKLAIAGWLVSLVLGLGVGLLLEGTSAAFLVVGLALTTTALGTILPMLHDSGVLPTPFGARAMAVGAVGECGPIVAIALLLGGGRPARTAMLLVAFAAITVFAAALAVRRRQYPQISRLLRATLHTSGQLAIRFSMFMVVAMVWVAGSFGLDVLLGAFAAGIIERLAIDTQPSRERGTVKSKLEAIGYGFLVPFFFVVSGVRLDLAALFADPWALLLVPVFLALFLVVRGGPVMVLYRRDLPDRADRRALALLAATALPMVVVITTIGLEDYDLRPSVAAALVCAAMLSVLILPLAAFRARKRAVSTAVPDA